MNFKDQLQIFLLCFSLLLTGCYSSINNQTPRRIPQNPSNSYKIAMNVKKTNVNILSESYESRVVIDGIPYNMTKSNNFDFYFDYKIEDENKHNASYYYEVSYQIGKKKKQVKSKTFKLNIINRYAIGFECNRGRPYSKISLLGRGFVDGDTVKIGDYLCDTTFISPNVLRFVIPLIEGGRAYKVILDSENGDIGLGEFYVDTLDIRVVPGKLNIISGERQILSISIDIDAPEVGLPLDITTDIPDSIIMHDVSIRPSMRSAKVVVEGGVPGKGSLFISAPGFSNCIVPVTVESEISSQGDDFEYSSLTGVEDEVNLLE